MRHIRGTEAAQRQGNSEKKYSSWSARLKGDPRLQLIIMLRLIYVPSIYVFKIGSHDSLDQHYLRLKQVKISERSAGGIFVLLVSNKK